MTSTAPNPFIKQLAANDRPTRDTALSSLRAYLSFRRTPFTHMDFLAIWKGLFYSMWHSDRPRPQQALANALAELISAIPSSEQSLEFQRAFWETMSREWDKIDVLRMDKFLLLVRRYVGGGMRWGLKKDKVEEWCSVVVEWGLETRDKKIPTGLRLHTMDIWVDEVEKVLGEKDEEERVKLVEALMKPVHKMKEEGLQKQWRRRAEKTLSDDRLKNLRGDGSEDMDVGEREGEDEEWGGIQD